MKRIVARIVLVLLVLTAAWYGWTLYNGAHTESANSITLHGNVEIRQVDLGFRVGGRIALMQVQEGERVRTGDLLARLDDVTYSNELKAAEAQVAMQDALLRKAMAGFRPEEIEQARAAVAEAAVALENAQSNYNRVSTLGTKGGVSQQNVEDAQARFRQTQARLNSARTQLAMLESGMRQEDIEAQQASLGAAAANLAKARTALADADLLAPSDGVVLTRVREPGAIVQAGQPVYTLTLSQPVYLRVFVPQTKFGLVRPGASVLVEVDSVPGKQYHGTIGHIAPVAEFTPKTVETGEVRADLVFRVRVLVNDPDNVMRQGMPVTVKLLDSKVPQ